MNYEGEKFLLQLYQDLDKQEGVLIAEKRSGKNSGNKYELLEKYLKRLERQEKVFDGEHEELEKFLKNRYYDRYVINEDDIPDSYWELQKRIALERGYGHLEYTDELKHKEALTIIENQKKSLDKWLNYLLKENTSYPMWTRYWAFQGMLKLGKYDKEKHSFTKRSKGTVSPFVELNAEALAHTIRTVQSYYEGNGIEDKELKQLVESGNFGKIYSYNIWKLIEEEKKNNKDQLDTNDGIWRVFTEGQEKDLIKLLEGKGTGWCIAEEETAKDYLEDGDMYIYFTKDKKGKYTMPRVCIRQEYDEIAEVRGIAEDQNMENDMLDITDKKLDEFEDKELYKQKVRDMKKLTKLYKKSKNGQEFTNDEFRFLYEIDHVIEGFGWEEDPRIYELRKENPITNREIALEAVKKKGNILYYLNDELKSDKEVVFEAVKNDFCGNALEYASENLRNDKELVAEVVEINSATKFIGVSRELLKNKQILLAALKADAEKLGYTSEELKNDKEIVLAAVKENGRVLKYASETLKNDKEVALAAVKENGYALEYAGEELKKDREVVLAAVKENGYALEYASEELKKDKDFVLSAVKEDGRALEYASKEFRNDKEIVLEAVKNWDYAFEAASKELQNDKEVALAAVKENGYALEYAGEKLKKDREVVLAAVKENGYALKYASEELKKDKDFVLSAARGNRKALVLALEQLQFDDEFMAELHELYHELRSNNYGKGR